MSRDFAVRLAFALAIGLPIGAIYAQDLEKRIPTHPWVHKPSARLAAALRSWRLTFKFGEQQDSPEKGVFASFAPGYRDGTARLVSDRPVSSLKLKPVAARVRYVPRGSAHTDPSDRDVTSEIIETLRSTEIVKFVGAERLNDTHLDVDKDFAVALVQDFDVAWRAPKKEEHVWSINWRVERQTQTKYAGYEAWGLFTRVNGTLHPFYLAGRESNGEGSGASYYYILAIGDLNGDGIDELVAREMGFEKEQDDLELWSWEGGAPVTIYRMSWL